MYNIHKSNFMIKAKHCNWVFTASSLKNDYTNLQIIELHSHKHNTT